jgi:hypothetical protein
MVVDEEHRSADWKRLKFPSKPRKMIGDIPICCPVDGGVEAKQEHIVAVFSKM